MGVVPEAVSQHLNSPRKKCFEEDGGLLGASESGLHAHDQSASFI